MDALDAAAWRAAMQRAQAGAGWPVGATLGYVTPDALRYLLDAADHQMLMVVAVGHHHAEDFQHRVGEVRVPAARAETDLTEDFAVLEAELGEGARGGDEIIEGAIVPQRNQGVPQLFQARYIAVTDGLLDLAELGAAFQSIGPGIGHFRNNAGRSEIFSA